MLINIGINYTIADIETIENTSKQIEDLFKKLHKKYNITEYVKISTCNRFEYYINNNYLTLEEPLLNNIPKNTIIKSNTESIKHLFRMSSGLESMIVGEDQILGQIKDAKNNATKENHCGELLDIIFTKAIHVGQVARNKTSINQGSVSIGSAAVDLAEENIGNLKNKCVLVIGAGEMGGLVAKAMAEKDLKAIFVANRTYFRAKRLAKELNGEAILIDDLNNYITNADVIISATAAPHPILTKEKIEPILKNTNKNILMIDIANPRDISEDVEELNIKLLNIDDLRGVADKNLKTREKEIGKVEKIINQEIEQLEKSLKLLQVEDILKTLRSNMEQIRIKESEKAILKLADVPGSVKIIDGLTKSIVNKIFYDLSINIKKAAEEEDETLIKAAEIFFKKEE